MDQLIVRVFDVLDHAEQACKQLFSEGFSRDSVELTVREDEAGPVEGNFMVGNSPAGSLQHTYDSNYAHVRQRGHCLVTVMTRGSAQAAHAGLLLDRCGGRDPDSARPAE